MNLLTSPEFVTSGRGEAVIIHAQADSENKLGSILAEQHETEEKENKNAAPLLECTPSDEMLSPRPGSLALSHEIFEHGLMKPLEHLKRHGHSNRKRHWKQRTRYVCGLPTIPEHDIQREGNRTHFVLLPPASHQKSAALRRACISSEALEMNCKVNQAFKSIGREAAKTPLVHDLETEKVDGLNVARESKDSSVSTRKEGKNYKELPGIPAEVFALDAAYRKKPVWDGSDEKATGENFKQ